MQLCRNALAVAVLLSIGPAAAQSPAAPPPPSGTMRVTTDTPEYCDSLAARVAQAERTNRQMPPQVEELAEEGHHMCATGLIRGGLVRLRRALMLLHVEK